MKHLFRLGPWLPWRTVSHNQMVFGLVKYDDLPRHDWSHLNHGEVTKLRCQLMTEYEELTFWKVNEHDLITRKNWSSQCIENTGDFMTYLPKLWGLWRVRHQNLEDLWLHQKLRRIWLSCLRHCAKSESSRIPEKSLMDCDPDIPPRYWLVLPLIRINQPEFS